jgi:hypothetical protein
MSPNYTLEIVSHHPKFNGRSLRKYDVEGIETVGAYGDEEFSVVFKNHTWQKVQVKLSLDGTDILTGEPADTCASDQMWVVNGYGTITVKAWPEDNNGGAAFIFTSANNSVAVHTHGDMSSRGIIAAAVFTEGHVEPVRLQQEHHHHHHTWWPYITYPTYPTYDFGPIWTSVADINTTGGLYGNSTYSAVVCNNSLGSASFSCDDSLGDLTSSVNSVQSCVANTGDGTRSKASRSLESVAAIGAGQYTPQQITHVAGLIKPVLSETVRVRYLWWDHLVEKLRTQSTAQPQPSGFPGDGRKKNIDLKGTPRIGDRNQRREQYVAQKAQQIFERF